MESFDVTIVGAGIAGSALSATLTPAGLSVLLLERQVEYRDRVRGEFMAPWGVVEMLNLGLDNVLLAAGGAYSTRLVNYDERTDPAKAEKRALPMDQVLDGAPGALGIGHPDASTALRSLAQERGARVHVGVGDVDVTAGPDPSVRYDLGGERFEASSRLIVGADGRQSTVRRGLGLRLHQTRSKATLGGLLVRTSTWPGGMQSITSVENDRFYLAFPRADGYVRLYLACEPNEHTAGADRGQHMLEAYRASAMPFAEAIESAEVAGPCAYVHGTDAWPDQPVSEGVALIGDAAGWSDPIVGQGLAVALRDARMVSAVLLGGDNWAPAAFRAYADERAERMRRIRIAAHVNTEINCTFTPQGGDRRVAVTAEFRTNPLTVAPFVAGFIGPESQPAEAFTSENVDRILSLR